jgi:hypothetical protein
MNRFTSETPDQLRFDFWLIFDRDGALRLVRGMPDSLDRNERAMAITATLPKSLWRTPSLQASISFPEGSAPAEIKIDVAAVSEAVKGALGVDVDVRVREPEE